MNFTFTNIDGLSIRIAQSRAPGKPTVVMTNALPQSIRCWESHWDALSERFDLVAIDLPGFGKSEGTHAMMRPSVQAEFLAKFLDALDIDRAFLVGPDIGVPVTLSFAARFPDRVLGLNIFDGPGTWPPDFSPQLRMAANSRLARWLGNKPPLRKRLMNQNYEVATQSGYHHFEPSREAQAEYRELASNPITHSNAFAFLGSYPEELPKVERQLAQIKQPVLITWGAEDRFVLPSNAEQLHAKLPHSEITIFENAGHFSHEDAGDAWLDRLVAFVEAHKA